MPIHAPFWGVLGAHFPQMMSLIVLTPKRTILRRNHVFWAINRENRSRGSSWALVREKKDRTGQDRKKITKGLYFTYLWRSPHWSDVHENLYSGWCSRHNHLCQVSKWYFQGLQFYRRSNFPFFLLILNWLYNSAALQRCLWLGTQFNNGRRHWPLHVRCLQHRWQFWCWTVCRYSEITCKCCMVFMARFHGVHAFGCNSAGSEAIWIKIVAHS